jgi:hypothetical protein
MDPMKAYRTGCFYWSIGSGKSFLTVLTNLFISLHLALMYAPYKFFGGSPASVYVQTMASYSQKKSSELLIEPFLQVLETSEFFQKVRSHEILNKLDIELKHSDKLEHIYWSTATPSSVLQMSNKINYKLISSAMGLLGQSIVCGSCSEIAFLKSEGGWSDEKIMTFFSKLRQRISSRLRGNYYGRTILDTSPNSVIDSPIDDWIVNEATKNPKENFVLQGSRWKVFKNEFKNFYTITENLNPKDVSPITSNTENIVKTSDEIWTAKYHDWSVAFPIYLGGNGIPPLIIENEAQLQPFEENDIIWCPRVSDIGESYLDKAQENVIEFLKDMAGRPTSAVDRIFYDHRIIEKIFDNNLKNMYTHITADAMDEPEHLIWDQIKDLLFYKISNRYFYHYEPDIKRTISVDQSYAQDLTCIACSHVERDPTRIDPETNDSMKVFVTDFTVNLVPVRGQQINLDAIRYFIMDLIQLGNLIIGAVSFDNFQSIPTQQALKRFGLTVDYVTVDKINDPYLTFCSLINQNRYFCGKNLHFKNNLKSLQWVKRNKKTGTLKVDHTKGEIITEGNTDWQTGLFGKNSKDCSDATCASVYLLNLYPEKFVPYKIWDKNIIERSYQTVQNETSKMLDKLGLAL